MRKENYLGDGLYASYDGYMICLRTPRENGDHLVYLEPETLQEFLRFVSVTKQIDENRRTERD